MIKMKKIVSLVLALVLACSLAVSAYAAEPDMDQRLQAVTLKAKQTLGIGDEYSSFTGSLTESSPTPQWSLYWSNDDESLQVRITETGKVLQYYSYQNGGTYSSQGGSLAKFPSMSLAQAQSIADTFLGKVLDTGVESARLTANGNQLSLYKTNYFFQGALLVHGLTTPVSLSLTVDTDTQSVVSFNRSDNGQDYSTLPVPGGAISAADASKTLFGSVSMELNYAFRQDGGTDDSIAYPQYTPVSDGTKAVDALTGKLIDITPSYPPYPLRYNSETTKSIADVAGGLTEVELTTASELKGVLSNAALEADARGISGLGLTSAYHLDSVNYYAEQNGNDTSRIVANLNFTVSAAAASAGSDAAAASSKIILSGSYKSVTLDAKQGTLLSVSSYRGYDSSKPAVNYTRNQAETIARNFVSRLEAAKLSAAVLAAVDSTDTDAQNTEQLFTFNRTVNDIPFPQNSITVSVDTETGYIADYAVSWDDGIQFASAANLISAEQAAELYTKAVGAVLAYASVPDTKDSTTSQNDELRLAYVFSPESTVWGVDADSGKLLKSAAADTEILSYSDLSGSYASAAVTKLAKYGIGYSGGTFLPGKALTQEDLLTLLVAAGGNPVVYPLAADQTAQQEEDDLYQQAYSMGILTKAERQPTKLISRAELVKLIINGAGYGKLAKLSGIYSLQFKDASSVPSDLYGYVAIARGLGIISGNAAGNFQPKRTATRAEAALMLCNYMSK